RTSAGRVGLGQLTSPPAPMMPPGERQSALNQEAHGDGGGVAAARRQSGKQRALRLLLVEVEGLRIELTGERLDLRRVDDMGRAGEPPSDGEVLEIEAALPPEFLWLRHPCLPWLVTCIMIVTCLYSVNAAQELRQHAVPDRPQPRARG